MIRVTVELLPHGSEENKRLLGLMEIANTGNGNLDSGDYAVVMQAEYGVRKGAVKKFRRRNQSVWTLIGAALKLFGHTKHSPSLMEEIKS